MLTIGSIYRGGESKTAKGGVEIYWGGGIGCDTGMTCVDVYVYLIVVKKYGKFI